MDEQKMPRRPRRSSTEEQPKNESLVYGKNPVTELLKSGSGVDTVLIAEGMAPAVAAYYTAMAKEAGATVKRVHPNKLRLMTEPPGRGRLCQRDRICDRGGPAERCQREGGAPFPGAE